MTTTLLPALTLLDRLGLPVVLLDRAGECFGLTAEAVRLLGWTAEQLVGTSFLSRVAEREALQFQDALQAVGADGELELPIRVPRASGTHALLVARLAALDGRVLVHLQDLSVRSEVEAQRSALFQVAPDPMAIASPDGYITHVNPAWTRLLGWSGEEMRSRPFLDFVHPDDREATVLESGRVFAGVLRKGFQNRYATRDGAWRRVEWSTYLGSDGRAYASVRDVTEQARLLETAQAQLEAHLQNSPLAAVEFDAGFRVTRWSGQAEALFGWTAAEVLGRHPDDWGFAHPDDLPVIAGQTARMASGEAVHLVTTKRNLTKDGRVLTCQWFNSLIRGSDGEVISILSLAEDVTDRVDLERERAEAAAQFQATFDQSAVGMAHVGLDGRWLQVNRKLCDLVGYTADELASRTFQDITHPDDLEIDTSLAQQVLARKIDHYAIDKRYVRKDGALVWARLTVSMRRDSEGRNIHFLSIIEDISEQKHAQTALQQAQSELEARVEDRTRALARLNDSLSAEIQQRREIEHQLRDNDTRLRSILQHSHDAFIAVSEDGRVVDWNRAAESTFGWRRSEAIGRPMGELIVPARLRDAHAAGMQRYLSTGNARVLGTRVELPAIDRSGREFPIEITISAVQLGQRRLFTAFLHDVSARREAELRRAETERQLKAITENAPAMIAYLDDQEHYRFVNGAFADWYETTADAIIGKTVREFRGEAGYAPNAACIQRVLSGQPVQFERELESPSGRRRHAQVAYIPDVDEQGTVRGFHAMIFDISAQKQLSAVLAEKALTDELTGLPNRAAWNEELGRGIARAQRTGTGVAVMFLDLDGFKAINDTHGHGTGDEVLRQFAQRLKATLRESDFIARLAGDEFVVLLDRVADLDGNPPVIAQKILSAMEQPMRVHHGELQVTASVGIAVQRGPEFDGTGIMRRADEAMYVAKRASNAHFEMLSC